MEESKEKVKEKIKKDHTMWFIILIGILVIMLACTFGYAWKLKNTTENMDRVNAERVEDNNFNIENKDLTNYQGVWYQNEDSDYLEIKSVEDNKVVFDWFIYRIDMYENVTATIENGNIAKFTSKNNTDAHEITGTLTLAENTVKVNVMEQEKEINYLEKSYTYTNKKSESVDNNDIVNKKETKIVEEKSNTKIYTYNDVKGMYKATKEFKQNDGSKWTACYELVLYSDGTYAYDYSVDNAYGVMGNYMINGKEIILNKLFSHGSDIGVTKNKGQIKLTINDDGSLTDKNNLLENNKLKNIKLKKKSSIGKEDSFQSVYAYISYLESEAFK